MLAYLANRSATGSRQSSPNALLAVISVHIALLAAVMSAKMDLPGRIFDRPPKIISITMPQDPPPFPLPPHPSRPQPGPIVTRDPLPLPLPADPTFPTGPTVDPGPFAGAGATPTPQTPVFAPIRRDARLLTSPAELKPPYPPSKIVTGEEALLRLRLTIDDRGRVVAVDPVGRADSVFLETARRYLIAHWRYQPATEDGRATTSSVVITLRFQLDG